MTLLARMFPHGSVEAGLLTLALAVALGLLLGAVQWRGVRLGASGVLFVALVFGQFGLTVPPVVLQFLRDFALIIFVYALGLQVGPGFLASLKAEGLRLNLLSLLVVVLGALLTAGCVIWFHLPRETGSGLYAGAFTNTPSLAAGQDALRSLHQGDSTGTQAAADAGRAYTTTYPFGMVGPILLIAFLRWAFKINMKDERAALAAQELAQRPRQESMDILVTRMSAANIKLRDHPMLHKSGIILTRLLRDGQTMVPVADTELHVGDIVRAVGPGTAVEDFAAAVGEKSDVDLAKIGDGLQRADLIVTRTAILRKTLRQLNLSGRLGIAVGRIDRAGVVLSPHAKLSLYFGDRVTVIGPPGAIELAATELGNSPDVLNRPQLIPIFIGIVLGLLVGTIPLAVPGLRTSMRIGLAGGPMIVAIALSQLGNIGSFVWYMPSAANQLFRDFGLAVFLACVGLQSGDHFIGQIANRQGIELVIFGAIITTLPVLLVAMFARTVLKMNFVTLVGLVAGSMTSTPGLIFAQDMTGEEAPSVVYAAVAPLGLLTPIVCAQVMVGFLS